MGWLSNLLRGGEGEVGWDDLVHRVVERVHGLGRYGAKGRLAFPDDVRVDIAVPEGSVEVVRGFVADPRFEREVGAGLANRADLPEDELPSREYVVAAGKKLAVTAAQGEPKHWALAIDGGDRAGTELSLPAGANDLDFGRGDHNDLIVCDRTEFVSRRAGRLFRTGNLLEVSALDQGDMLVVRRPGGDTVRPSRTARNRTAVREGDVIELADGEGATVKLVVKRIA